MAPLGSKYSIISVTLALPPGISEAAAESESSARMGCYR